MDQFSLNYLFNYMITHHNFSGLTLKIKINIVACYSIGTILIVSFGHQSLLLLPIYNGI